LRRCKKQPQKRNGRQKPTRHPHGFVIFVHSLVHFRVLAIVMNVTGQTLLEKKRPNHSTPHFSLWRLSNCWVKTVVGNVRCFVPFARTKVAKKKPSNKQPILLEGNIHGEMHCVDGKNNHTTNTTSRKKKKQGCGKLSGFAGKKKAKNNNKSNFINIQIVDCQ
jgi:hypothetical protein